MASHNMSGGLDPVIMFTRRLGHASRLSYFLMCDGVPEIWFR